MGVTATLADQTLDFIFKGSIPVYVSLHTAVPQPGIDEHEVTGTNYAREFVAASDWSAAASSETAATVAVTFAPAGGSWGTITHLGIYDAATSGNLLAWGELATPKLIGPGDTVGFPIGNLVGSLS